MFRTFAYSGFGKILEWIAPYEREKRCVHTFNCVQDQELPYGKLLFSHALKQLQMMMAAGSNENRTVYKSLALTSISSKLNNIIFLGKIWLRVFF